MQAFYPNNREVASYWNTAMGWDAILDATERNIKSEQPYYTQLNHDFYSMMDRIGWKREYIDDMNWMALALLRAYNTFKDDKFLKKGVELYGEISRQWDETCCCKQNSTKPCVNGGIFWDTSHTQKATAANAGPVILGARLYKITRNTTYSAFATKVYKYWWSNMVDQNTYQVCDNIEAHTGEKRWWKFTYNEGLMIGASVEMQNITGDSTYLQNAYKIADFVLKNEVTADKVLVDSGDCEGDCQEFKGVGFRYLMLLYTKDRSRTSIGDVLRASADAIWNRARRNDDTFSTSWTGPAPSSDEKISQAMMNSATMALNIFANNN